MEGVLPTGPEDEETDARVYNPPHESLPSLSPPIPTPNDPKTKSPETKTVYFLPKGAKSYELDQFKENLMIIVNNDKFLKGKPRPGSSKDKQILEDTFEKYGFKIAAEPYDNLAMQELLDKVKAFAHKTDFSSCGCICVAILTHGNEEPGKLKAYDNFYSEQDIFKYFDACQNNTLAAKPIVFLIQACRGPEPASKVNTASQEKTTASQLDNSEESYHIPTECDRIIFHSCYINKASVRHPKDGSWFIQNLCEKVQEFAHSHDLETIFKMVRNTVALDCVTDEDWKQMPVVTTTTLRDLYLVPTAQMNTLQGHADEPARPSVCRCETNNPLPSVPDCSTINMMMQKRPCCYFLEYFDYLKRCLDDFCSHNPRDVVATHLLGMVKRTPSGSAYNMQKFTYITHMWEYLENKKNDFPPHSFKFLHRSLFVSLKETDTSTPLS